MRNIIITFFMAIFCLGISSCSNEVGIPDPGPKGNPEKEIAGTYVGKWTKTLDNVSTEAPGSITFTPGERAYVTDVKVDCPDMDLNFNGLANIVNNSEGYIYYNQEAKQNGFGVTYTGRVIRGQATIKFIMNVKEGRKQYLYTFEFLGEKIN